MATRWPGRSSAFARALPQMLERAGAPEVARRIDAAALEEALPRVTEAAYRARYEHDDAKTRAGALAKG